MRPEFSEGRAVGKSRWERDWPGSPKGLRVGQGWTRLAQQACSPAHLSRQNA